MDLSVSSLSQSRFEETPVFPARLLPSVGENITSSTRKGRLWYESNKEKLRKYARNQRPASPSPPRQVFNSRPTVPSRPSRSLRSGQADISDSRFLLSSLAEQVDILVGLVSSVCESGNFLLDSLAHTLQRQSEIFSQTITQSSEKFFRSEIFRAEIVRKNLDAEKSLLKELRRLQAQALSQGIHEEFSDLPVFSDHPPTVIPSVSSDELKAWMEDIRHEISDLKVRLSPRFPPSPPARNFRSHSPPQGRSPSPPGRATTSPGRATSPLEGGGGGYEISDLELEELQRARERLERQLGIRSSGST